MMDFLLGAAESAVGLLDPFNLGGFLAAGVLIRAMWQALGAGVLWGIALMFVAHNLVGATIVGTWAAALSGTVIGSLAATWVAWEIAALVRRLRAAFARKATPAPGAGVGSRRREGEGD